MTVIDVTGNLHTIKTVSRKCIGYRTDLLEEKRTQSQSLIIDTPSSVLNEWHSHML